MSVTATPRSAHGVWGSRAGSRPLGELDAGLRQDAQVGVHRHDDLDVPVTHDVGHDRVGVIGGDPERRTLGTTLKS